MKDIGVYVHIPFCVSKCYYCDFVSFSNKDEYKEKYVKAILEEIDNYMYNEYNIKTVYIGGGTPSVLDSEFIFQIMEKLKKYIKKEAEITIEVNPATVNKEKLRDYINVGINRISIGVQSSKKELLKEIGRIHSYSDFLETYEMARITGFKNINVDLMLGLPNQTLKDLKESVLEVIKLNPEHISVYSLILEKDTKLYDIIEQGKLKTIDEELERKMYWNTKRILEEHGYIHYEISNFAKNGYMSRHNVDCWEQKEYIGFGLAAHSYLNNIRYSNITNIEEYINNIRNKDFEKNIIIHEKQNKEDQKKEYIMLGLRKIEGISISKYKAKFMENPIFVYKSELEKLIKQNLLEINGDRIKLTNRGLDFANIVFEEFI